MNIEPSRIIVGCNEAAASELIPCIKQSVYAMLVTASGREFFGSNWMSTTSGATVCPRVTEGCPSGQGYELCQTVCNQEFHAEVAALRACVEAGETTEGAVIYLTGHTYCCDNCIVEMTKAGIYQCIVLDSGKVYSF
jgi:deoxycytidylate deaminase